MAERRTLEQLLRTATGPANYYFQPPEGYKLSFPALVYRPVYDDSIYADNKPYVVHTKYKVTYITRDPDSDIHKAISGLPRCRCTNSFVSDNLYHWEYELFYN